MARQESLIQWITKNRSKLGLKAQEFSWARQQGIELFDFEVEITANGFKGEGRGSDFSEVIAMEKAISEAVERSVCSSLNISSVGVAAHTEANFATENAKLEFFERYSFDRIVEADSKVAKFHEFHGAVPVLASLVPGVMFYSVSLEEGLSLTVCFLDFEGQKFLGLSCGKDEDKAREKSLLEVARNYSAFYVNRDGFEKLISEDSNYWCCDNQFLARVERLMVGDPVNREPLGLPEYQIDNLEYSHLPDLSGCPLVIRRAKLKQAVDL